MCETVGTLRRAGEVVMRLVGAVLGAGNAVMAPREVERMNIETLEKRILIK